MNTKSLSTFTGISQKVCEIYNKEPREIKSKTRLRIIVFPRQVCMALSLLNTGKSPTEIGNHYGGYDRNTVRHAVKVVKNLLDTDKNIRKEIGELFQDAKWPVIKDY